MAPAPPAWADAWLRLLLPARDRDTVSGDLMEEYRENVRPQRSQLAADAWYVGQVSRFAWRQGLWALALATLFEARTAFDWFVPATNFAPRSEVTTLVTVATLLVIGASSTMRTRSLLAGVVSTATALVGSAVICSVVTAFMYWNWQSPALISAISGSGGLAEVFILPIVLIVPGTAIGATGGLLLNFGSRSLEHKRRVL
jgi:hypothetical protein